MPGSLKSQPRALIELLQRHRFTLLWMGCLAVIATAWIRVVIFGSLPYFLADFLISYADGPVRRGLAGQVILGLSGALGGRAVIWALILASCATIGLFWLAIRLFRAVPEDPAWLPLMLAPMGLLFLAYDPNGSVRKEVLAYLSLLLVLQGAIAASGCAARRWTIAGSAGFLLALLAHEAIILLWPALCISHWLVQRRWPGLRWSTLVQSVLTGLVGLAIAVWVTTLAAPDPEVICAAARLDHCPAAIVWLEKDLSHAVATVIRRRAWIDLPVFGGYGLLCLLPFLGLRWTGRPQWKAMAIVAAPLIAVAPLFVIGFDWGRWLHMAVFPLSLICLAAAPLGETVWRWRMPPVLLVLYLGSWSLPHAGATINYAGLAIWPALGLAWGWDTWRKSRAGVEE